jgi:D-inositol-3-phosphate glycosyltransferase
MRKIIAFISEHASPLATLGGVDSGGQNVYVAELCKELARKHYCIDVFTRREDEAVAEIVSWLPNIRVIHVKAGPAKIIAKEDILGFMDEFAQNMLSFIRTEQLQYTIVHANFFMSGLVASKIKKALSVPYVITFHALGLVRQLHQKEMDKFPAQRTDIEKFLVQDADGIIAECPQDKDDLVQHYQAPEEKITIIPCGFSRNEFKPIPKREARQKTNLPIKEFIILQLGRMVPRKGVDNVIRAAGRLRNTITNFRLVIVGGDADMPQVMETSEIARLLNIADKENVAANITFTGRKNRQELKYYYSAADVFITTPWYEPFGITPLEAMACGTPVIGANVGGIKYSVAEGQTGFLVPPNEPGALAARIGHLYNDASLKARMSKNALARVNRHFTWQCVAESIMDLYEKLATEKVRQKSHGRIISLQGLVTRAERTLVPLPGTFNMSNA